MDYANVVSTRVALYSKRGVRTVRYPPLPLRQKRSRLTALTDALPPDHRITDGHSVHVDSPASTRRGVSPRDPDPV